MKSAKAAAIRPVHSINSIPDAIAAATYILTGEARRGLSVNEIIIEERVTIIRGTINWAIVIHSSMEGRIAPTFWMALYECTKSRQLAYLDFAKYEVTESEPIGGTI